MSTDDSSRTRKSTLPLHSLVAEARQRRSTLETFNDELAVLERPLEGDVEYVDEPKPVALAADRVRGGGGDGGRRRGAVRVAPPCGRGGSGEGCGGDARARGGRGAVTGFRRAGAGRRTAPAEAPAPTEAAAPAAAAPEADEAADDDAAASDDSARRAPASKGAWAKVRSKAGHAKPARATSGKSTTYRRTTTTTTDTPSSRSASRVIASAGSAPGPSCG